MTEQSEIRPRPGVWQEAGGLNNLVMLDIPARTPGMVVVAKADENWQTRPELRWQVWPDQLIRITTAEVAMESAQQKSLDEIWDHLKDGVYDKLGLPGPTIAQDDEYGQAIDLPLSKGGSIRVKRLRDSGDWFIP